MHVRFPVANNCTQKSRTSPTRARSQEVSTQPEMLARSPFDCVSLAARPTTTSNPRQLAALCSIRALRSANYRNLELVYRAAELETPASLSARLSTFHVPARSPDGLPWQIVRPRLAFAA